MRVIVGTSVAKYHRWPGALDLRLAYVKSLAQLGHDVYLFDDVSAAQCAVGKRPVPFSGWPSAEGFEAAARAYGLWDRCCLIYDGGAETRGLTFEDAVEVAESTDVLLNVNGKLRTEAVVDPVGVRVLIDEAPGHTQVYEAIYGIDQGIRRHDVHYTFGANVGTARCGIPDAGVSWHPLCPPVDLSSWSVADEHDGRFTTISNWEGEATFELNGRYSGEKSDNWRRFIGLPSRTDATLEIALNIHPAWEDDVAKLRACGWRLRDPRSLDSLDAYQRYLGKSMAEFSVANNRYVEFSTGWFSDRSARYLARGRPVVVQDTGIAGHLPVGDGLLTFRTLDEAIAAIDEVRGDYDRHRAAARKIAEEHFDGRRVLAGVLQHVEAGP